MYKKDTYINVVLYIYIPVCLFDWRGIFSNPSKVKSFFLVTLSHPILVTHYNMVISPPPILETPCNMAIPTPPTYFSNPLQYGHSPPPF